MPVIYHDKSTKTLRVTTATGNHLDILMGDNTAQAKIETTNHLVLNAAGSTSNLQFELEGAERMRLTRQGAGTQAALLIGDVYEGAFTADAKLVLQTDGDCGLHIIADDDNIGGEGDNPLIKLSQDGGTKLYTIGMAGVAGSFFTGSLGDAAYVHGVGGTFQIATAGSVAITVDAAQETTLQGNLVLQEISAPGTPPTGSSAVYVKTVSPTSHLFFKDDGGNERDLTPAPCAFKAYDDQGGDVELLSSAIFPGNVAVFNIGSHYNTSTYKFTAPQDGLYQFSWNSWSTDNPANGEKMALMVNTSIVFSAGEEGNGECFTTILVLSADDLVFLQAYNTVNYYAGATWNEFSGHYIGPSS